MPESDLVYVNGSAVDVGEEGEHTFEFVEGEHLTDSGISNIVFVEDVGVGGVGWDFYFTQTGDDAGSGDTDGFEFTVGVDLLADLSHDGRNYTADTGLDANVFGVVRRREPVDDETNFTLTFENADATFNSSENNKTFGVFDGDEPTRPFDNTDVAAMYISFQEKQQGGPLQIRCQTTDGSGTNLDRYESTSVPSLPADIGLQYDGSTVTILYNGSSITTLDAPSPRTWFPAMNIEDDDDVDEGDSMVVESFDLA